MLGEMTFPLPLQSGHLISPMSSPLIFPLPSQVRHFVHLLLNHPTYVLPRGVEPRTVGLKDHCSAVALEEHAMEAGPV